MGPPRPQSAPNKKGEEMKNELEIKFQMAEMFDFPDRVERSRTQSLQKSTDAIDGFFERLEIQETLGGRVADFEKLVAERLSSSNYEPKALSDLRGFIKTEKQRVPTMTTRQVRSSVVNVLRKAADAMAAL